MIFYGFPYGLCSGLLAIATFLASFIGVAAASGWQGIVEEYVTLSVLKSLGVALGVYWLQGVLTAFFVVLRERKRSIARRQNSCFTYCFSRGSIWWTCRCRSRRCSCT